MIKKADVILFIALCLLGGGISFFTISSSVAGTRVEIYTDGKLYGTYSLDSDRKVEIKSQEAGQLVSNTVTISGSKASMTHSTCKNQVCVHTGAIYRSGGIIACLPNKVIVKISGGNEGGDGDVDIVTG